MQEERKTQRQRRQKLDAHYHAMLEDLPCFVCRFLPDSEIIYVNTKYCEYFGKTREELIGGKFTSLIPEEGRQAVMDNILSLTVDSPSMTHEHKVMAPDGQIRWQRWTNRALFDAHGRAVLFQSYGEDITERRKAEEALYQSEERLRLFMDSATEGFTLWDAEFNLISANQTVLNLFPPGTKLEHLIGKNALEIVPNLRESGRYDQYREVMKTGKPLFLNDLVPHPKFGDVCLDIKAFRVSDGLGLTFTDITERKRQEQILRESEENFRAIFDNATDGILVADPQTRQYITGNRRICQMLGYTLDELKNMEVKDIHPKETLSEDLRKFEKVLKREITLSEDVPIRRKDGRVRYVDINTALLRFSGKECLMGIFRDVTERKQAQERLDACREHMARAERLVSVGTVSAMAAHELTQPLMVMRLSIENALADLEGTSYPNGVREGLKNSLSEISQAVSIIDRLRKFARVSFSREVKSIHLDAVAKRVTQLLDGQARQTGMALSLKNLDHLPPVRICEKDMEQLFFALVQNAVQAAEGKKNRRLTIYGSLQDRWIELQFSDNCGGMLPETLDRIFDPFFTTKPAGEGTGLGLCVVERIVSQIGGSVRVESQAGQGSTFFVTLPIHPNRKDSTQWS